MPRKTAQLNKANFFCFFSSSFLSLFALFLLMAMPLLGYKKTSSLPLSRHIPEQYQVNSVYTLAPLPSQNIEMIVSSPNSGYGINAVLKDDRGNIILNQNNLSYDWQIDNSVIARVISSGFDNGCPYNINSPCPNLHADIIAYAVGETTIRVRALRTINNTTSELARTTFNLKVLPREAAVSFKIKFRGIENRPGNTSEQRLTVKGYNLTNESIASHCRQFTDTNKQVSVDSNGIYNGYINLDDCYLNKPGFKLCVKGPRHLQKCFKDITFMRDQTLDFTSQPLDPGDLALPQDGKVDNADFNYLWDHRGSTNSEELKVGDLNLDGAINMGDINLLLETLQVRYDEEGW